MPQYKITFSRTVREHHTATVTAKSIADVMRLYEEGAIDTTVSDSAILSEDGPRIVEK